MQIKTDLTKQVLAFYWLLNKVLCLVFFLPGVTGAMLLPQTAINSQLHCQMEYITICIR